MCAVCVSDNRMCAVSVSDNREVGAAIKASSLHG